MTGQVLDRLSRASAEKWQVMGKTAQAEGWGPTLRLCLLLLVVQSPVGIAVAVGLVYR